MKIQKSAKIPGLFVFIFAFLFVFAGSVQISLAQFAKFVGNSPVIEIDAGTSKIRKSNIQKIFLHSTTTGTVVYLPSQIQERRVGSMYILTIAKPANMPTDLTREPVQLDILVKLAPDKDEITAVPIQVNAAGFETTYSTMLKSLKLEQAKAKGKDDAELYLSGEFSTAVKSKPNWTADIKYEREFGKRGFPFLFAPFVNLKYNNKVKNDTDKLSFGIRFSNSFGFKVADTEIEEDEPINALLENTQDQKRAPKFTKIKRAREQREYFLYRGSGEFESDWDFRVNNLITSQEIHYLVKPLFFDDEGVINGKLILTPFIGAELGRNLKNPTIREDLGIARFKAGAVLTLNLDKPIKNFFIKDLTWENKFTRRWFLANEIAYDKNDAGELIEKEFGKKPRSHFMSTLEFKFNDFFGPALIYEWGEVPPLYNKVNHKVKLALVYSFKRKALP